MPAPCPYCKSKMEWKDDLCSSCSKDVDKFFATKIQTLRRTRTWGPLGVTVLLADSFFAFWVFGSSVIGLVTLALGLLAAAIVFRSNGILAEFENTGNEERIRKEMKVGGTTQ